MSREEPEALADPYILTERLRSALKQIEVNAQASEQARGLLRQATARFMDEQSQVSGEFRDEMSAAFEAFREEQLRKLDELRGELEGKLMAEADQSAADERQAVERTLRFARAMVDGDAHALEELLAPGFTYTHRSARLEPRDELVTSVRGGRHNARMDLEEMSVRAYGGATVVQGVAHMRAGPADAPLVFDSHFTAVWVHSDDSLRLAVYHSTGLAQD